MKKLKNALLLFLLLPVMVFCGCSKNTTKPINAAPYLSATIKTTRYNISDKTIPTEAITNNSPDLDYADKYLTLEATAKPEWIYKMYIESIYFYVYTNILIETEMIVNISLTNVVKEEDIFGSTEDNKISEQCTFIPLENNSKLCKVEVNRTVATATATKITFDINNSVHDLFVDENGETRDFKWLIYGLEIVGESRTYNEK